MNYDFASIEKKRQKKKMHKNFLFTSGFMEEGFKQVLQPKWNSMEKELQDAALLW